MKTLGAFTKKKKKKKKKTCENARGFHETLQKHYIFFNPCENPRRMASHWSVVAAKNDMGKPLSASTYSFAVIGNYRTLMGRIDWSCHLPCK